MANHSCGSCYNNPSWQQQADLLRVHLGGGPLEHTALMQDAHLSSLYSSSSWPPFCSSQQCWSKRVQAPQG